MRSHILFVLIFITGFITEGVAQNTATVTPANQLLDSAVYYRKRFKLAKALSFLDQYGQIVSKDQGENSLLYSRYLYKKGLVYSSMTELEESNKYYEKALKILHDIKGDSSLEAAYIMEDLATNQVYLSQFKASEESIGFTETIFKRHFSAGHNQFGIFFLLKGFHFLYMGNRGKAEPLLLEACRILEQHPDSFPDRLAEAYGYLGAIQRFNTDFDKAEQWYLKAISTTEKYDSANQYEIMENLSRLGTVNWQKENYPASEKYYLRALRISKSLNGETDAVNLDIYNKLGLLYWFMDDFQKAESHFLAYLKTYQYNKITQHSNKIMDLRNICLFYLEYNQPEKALPFIRQSCKISSDIIARLFPTFSENQKSRYLYQIKESLDLMDTYSFLFQPSRKELSEEMFDQRLEMKGIVFSSKLKFKKRMKESKDSLIRLRYRQWEELQTLMAKKYGNPSPEAVMEMKKLMDDAENLEALLSRQSSDFSELKSPERVSWKDVRKKLKPGEAAIEMVFVKGLQLNKKPAQAVQNELKDSVFYAALIIRPSSEQPELVRFTNGTEMEKDGILHYRRCISKRVQDLKSYALFWEKIDTQLGKEINKIYFSPDGLYHALNLNTLYNPNSGKYLLEERNIHLVTSTRELVDPSNKSSNPDHVCFIGAPDFDNLPTAASVTAMAYAGTNSMKDASRDFPKTSFGPLPGTQSEIETIARIFSRPGWKTDTFLGKNATEQRIKQIRQPRILHIATHGYFRPSGDHSLRNVGNSGLAFTGANQTIAGNTKDQEEDGILTVFEAMNLNLDNTDLVVLSACETGLGEIENGEGVYGLQRSFSVAGARTLLMSLWKVSDQATKELMVEFYKNWIQTKPAKHGDTVRKEVILSKRDSFRKAQMKLKTQYPDPYYWGAFVMVGE